MKTVQAWSWVVIATVGGIARADEWEPCRKQAQKVISKAKGCGVDMRKYTAAGVCAELRKDLAPADAVRRLGTQLENDCRSMQVMVSGDRL